MAGIDTVRAKLRARQYRFAVPHFFEEMDEDDLIFDDIWSAIQEGAVRRKFTHDPRGTRYEIVGPTTDGRWAAVICRIKTTGELLLITTYVVE
jgi:hypothetical protein